MSLRHGFCAFCGIAICASTTVCRQCHAASIAPRPSDGRMHFSRILDPNKWDDQLDTPPVEQHSDLSHSQAIERQHEADWLRALPTPSQAKH